MGKNLRAKKLIVIIALLLLGSFAGVSAIYLDLRLYANEPAAKDGIEKLFVVLSGQDLRTTARALEKSGLIQHGIKFRLLTQIKGCDKKIRAGEYALSAVMSPAEILDVLVRGKVFLYKFMVPEGYNLTQIASLVDLAGFGAREAFIQESSDTELLQKARINAETFEGYLFPDTYYFSKNVTPEKIVDAMVRRFWSVFTSVWRTRAENMGFSIHEVVTLASIIEKETGVSFERPLISSVFHNRLQKRMRLESDPTVIYGIENFDGNLTRKHLRTTTPYNTYMMKGLPPGPIANPGLKSIEAALYPADTSFLYFVSKKDGTHQFSTNIKDHNKAVKKYQLRRSK
ncbi:endolytic transglycosylase MltG [Thermodesulfobacteriota bacterium]